MNSSSSRYVLAIIESAIAGSDELSILESLLGQSNCPVVAVQSSEQAVLCLRERLPSLVILIGHRHDYSKPLVHRLRRVAAQDHTQSLMVIALTDVNDPHWLPQEDNPGFDGFLVKPLSGDILTSLVQSAWIRQTCRTTL